MSNVEFLQWLHARLISVHGENKNADYMHKLRSIIEDYEDIYTLKKDYSFHLDVLRDHIQECHDMLSAVTKDGQANHECTDNTSPTGLTIARLLARKLHVKADD